MDTVTVLRKSVVGAFGIAVATAVFSFSAPRAEASVVTCPLAGTAGVVRFFTLDTDPSPACKASGTQAGADQAFLVAFPDFQTIEKSDQKDDDDNFVPTQYISSDTGDLRSGTSGEIDFTPPQRFTDFVILFKAGNPNINVSWAAFSVPSIGFDNGLWEIVDEDGNVLTQNQLSHVTLFGKVAPIPLPAAGFLLIGALGGLGLVARRRRRTA